MIMTNKLLPVALIAALVGGSVGALVMHTRRPSQHGRCDHRTFNSTPDATYVADRQVAADPYMPASFDMPKSRAPIGRRLADGFRDRSRCCRCEQRAPAQATYARAARFTATQVVAMHTQHQLTVVHAAAQPQLLGRASRQADCQSARVREQPSVD